MVWYFDLGAIAAVLRTYPGSALRGPDSGQLHTKQVPYPLYPDPLIPQLFPMQLFLKGPFMGAFHLRITHIPARGVFIPLSLHGISSSLTQFLNETILIH